MRDEVTPDEVKERMKKLGVEPMSPYQEKPFYISSTGAVLDAYVPAEGDGKVREKPVLSYSFSSFPILGKFNIHRAGKTGSGFCQRQGQDHDECEKNKEL